MAQCDMTFEIDNSSKMYPLAATKKKQTVYKIVLIMKENVDRTCLQTAVNEVIFRYPNIAVSMEKSFFRHYLKRNRREVKIFDLESKLYSYINEKDTNGYRFKISCLRNLIQIEIFHILTDGEGAMNFAKSVLMRYQELRGNEIGEVEAVKNWRDIPTESEKEDGYVQNSKLVKLKNMKLSQFGGTVPFRIKGTLINDGFLVETGIIDASTLVKEVKSKNVTVTAYLAGLLAYSIKQTSQNTRNVVMMIPVNLRSYYKSETLRNFVSFVDIVFDDKKCQSAEEYIQCASEQLKIKTAPEKIESMVSMSYTLMNLKFVRFVPRFIKSFVVKLWNKITKARQTTVFTNLGRLAIPEQLGIEDVVINMNASKHSPYNVAAVTVDGKLSITFTRVIKENDVAQKFFDEIRKISPDFKVFTRDEMIDGKF